jgi:hypothetical protein
MLVTVITAKSSKKLPKVSWPIESENDRILFEIGGDSAGVIIETGLQTVVIYDVFDVRGNMPATSGCGLPRPGKLPIFGSVHRYAGFLDHLGP